jgi:hypothetical protein
LTEDTVSGLGIPVLELPTNIPVTTPVVFGEMLVIVVPVLVQVPVNELPAPLALAVSLLGAIVAMNALVRARLPEAVLGREAGLPGPTTSLAPV